MPTGCPGQEAGAKKEVQKAYFGTSPEAASELSLHVIASAGSRVSSEAPEILHALSASRVSS